MKGTFEVTDLFKGAFLLCMGGRLEKVRVRKTGRKIATFLITGPNLDEMDQIYRSGLALVNPLQFRETLNHLRDAMFEKLRQDPASPKGCARVEGRERHDRKAGYRAG